MELNIKSFDALTPWELYEILKLRSAVFVVEQTCIYQDPDDKDKDALHIWVTEDDAVVACARVLPPGVSYAEAAVGRLASAIRGKGYGRAAMRIAVKMAQEVYGVDKVRISAQSYAKGFYEKLGFTAVSQEYLEDGIPHTEMLWEKQA